MADSSHAFAAAVLQRPGKLLGRRLMPYSLGHELLLLNLHSPLLSGGPCDLGSVLLAWEVLTRPFSEAEAALREDRGLQRALHWRGRWMSWLFTPDWSESAAIRLKNYIRKGKMGPPIEVKPGATQATDICLLQLLVLKLIGHGFNEATIWAMPYRLALWHSAAISEMNHGGLRIGDDAAEMQEALERLLPGHRLIRNEEVSDG